jgi:phosphoribosylformylglycinamidine synthase
VGDTTKTLTPVLDTVSKSNLFMIDLSAGHQRMACSALAQVYGQVGTQTPDVDDAQLLKNGFEALQQLVDLKLISAYHDRSDGGMISALLEMAFASRCGLDLNIQGEDALATLFNEELGAVIQVCDENRSKVEKVFAQYSVPMIVLGRPITGDQIKLRFNAETLLDESRVKLHRIWSETSYEMQKLRDNPLCAQQEYDRLLDQSDTGLQSKLSFDPNNNIAAPYINGGSKPKIAILREQGVNGHIEMGAAFTQADFSAIDVTMTDIIEQRVSLDSFQGLVACGGFSYGDVLGAGEGWAKSVLFNNRVRDEFAQYFARQDAFALGICNGCQMMSNLKEIIPGAEHWPHFVRNASEQFEARFVQSKVAQDTNSLFLSGMQGSLLPVVVAHGEGRAEYGSSAPDTSTLALSYVDYKGQNTEAYPANPNGSPLGIAGLSNSDGRVTIMMPHPERIFRSATNSWRDESWGEYSPWMRMFRNARAWVG